QTAWALVFLGLLVSGAGVAIRLNSSAPVFLERMAPGFRGLVLLLLTLLFGAMAFVTVALFLACLFGWEIGGWKPNSLFFLMIIVAPISFAAMKMCLDRAKPGSRVTEREEAAAILVLGALAAFCSNWALYNSFDPLDWDAMRMFLSFLALVALV